VVIHRHAVPLLTDCELPEVAIEPSHDGLDDVVQDPERDRGRHLDLTPDQGIGMPRLEHMGPQGLNNRVQRHHAGADPVGKRGDCQALTTY
jgi:hypothetical protein